MVVECVRFTKLIYDLRETGNEDIRRKMPWKWAPEIELQTDYFKLKIPLWFNTNRTEVFKFAIPIVET